MSAQVDIEKAGISRVGAQVQKRVDERIESAQKQVTETQQRVQDEIASIQSAIDTRIARVQQWGVETREDIERRRAMLVGRAKDASRRQALKAGERALGLGACTLHRVHAMSPVKVHVLKESSRSLKAKANDLADLERALDAPSVEGYDLLNVKKINAAMQGLDAYELTKLRAYEQANKNRVTVLREVERLLGG
ncbi:MAG: hypothetical protein AAGI01_14905 [Myxococcota bacterium]